MSIVKALNKTKVLHESVVHNIVNKPQLYNKIKTLAHSGMFIK